MVLKYVAFARARQYQLEQRPRSPLPKISLDFFLRFCHYLKSMQKIEKWRVNELALVLNELSLLLEGGKTRDWANVFSHFYDESQKIVSKNEFDSGSLTRLIKNIKNCFLGTSSFTSIILRHENSEEKARINQNLYLTRAHLLRILMDLEKRLVDYIS
jgi:hypothetical protein